MTNKVIPFPDQTAGNGNNMRVPSDFPSIYRQSITTRRWLYRLVDESLHEDLSRWEKVTRLNLSDHAGNTGWVIVRHLHSSEQMQGYINGVRDASHGMQVTYQIEKHLKGIFSIAHIPVPIGWEDGLLIYVRAVPLPPLVEGIQPYIDKYWIVSPDGSVITEPNGKIF